MPRTALLTSFTPSVMDPAVLESLLVGRERLAGRILQIVRDAVSGRGRRHMLLIGPHGSGKSTLLCALIPEIHRAGRGTLLIELHDGQRRLGVDLGREVGRKLDSVVIVDGYEQLALVNRWRLKRFCRRQGQGLVVTSHRTAGLPLVFRTEATPRLAEEIVRRLLQGLPATVDAAELERIFLRHRGNLREVLFELYDWYEQREAR